jgi:hypothetical protein
MLDRDKIKNGIIIEQQYLDTRDTLKTLSLLNRLSTVGYTSLDTYFKDKTEYLVRTSNPTIYEPVMLGIEDAVEASVKTKEVSVYIPTASDVFAWHGSETIDYDLCKSLGVTVYEMRYLGGTIISGPEDFSIAVIIDENTDVTSDYFMNRFYSYFRQYFSNVVLNNNDILINDKKILGSMTRRANGMFIFATQVSFVDRTNLINQICPPDSGKIPGCIDNSILTKEMLKNEVLSWLQ